MVSIFYEFLNKVAIQTVKGIYHQKLMQDFFCGRPLHMLNKKGSHKINVEPVHSNVK